MRRDPRHTFTYAGYQLSKNLNPWKKISLIKVGLWLYTLEFKGGEPDFQAKSQGSGSAKIRFDSGSNFQMRFG